MLGTAAIIVSVGLGIIIGYFSHPSTQSKSAEPHEDVSIQSKLMKSMKINNIKEHLRYMVLLQSILLNVPTLHKSRMFSIGISLVFLYKQ